MKELELGTNMKEDLREGLRSVLKDWKDKKIKKEKMKKKMLEQC